MRRALIVEDDPMTNGLSTSTPLGVIGVGGCRVQGHHGTDPHRGGHDGHEPRSARTPDVHPHGRSECDGRDGRSVAPDELLSTAREGPELGA